MNRHLVITTRPANSSRSANIAGANTNARRKRIIAATAVHLTLPLVAGDRRLQEAEIRLVW